jgi:hypothetical protein
MFLNKQPTVRLKIIKNNIKETNMSRVCPFARRIDPLHLILLPLPGKGSHAIVRAFEAQFA